VPDSACLRALQRIGALGPDQPTLQGRSGGRIAKRRRLHGKSELEVPKAKRLDTDTMLKLPLDFSATAKALLNTPRPPPAAEIVHVHGETALALSREAAVRSRELREAGDAARARVVPASRKGRMRALAALARALAYAVKNGRHGAAGGETALEGAFVRSNHALGQRDLLSQEVDIHAPTLRCPHCGARLIVMHRNPANTKRVSYHCMMHGAILLDSERRLLKERLTED
jgi:DNA-directed RNA polymerase subunit RPC12/RpoP